MILMTLELKRILKKVARSKYYHIVYVSVFNHLSMGEFTFNDNSRNNIKTLDYNNPQEYNNTLTNVDPSIVTTFLFSPY